MNDWNNYDFDAKTGSSNAAHLNHIAHIVHVRDSFLIVDRGNISKGRMYDASILTNTEASVVWLSPFDWPASIYGNICFKFDWESLSSSRNLYWVEMVKYPRPAMRYFLTERPLKDIPFKKHLQIYNPAKAQGPLKKVNGVWWYNTNTAIEIMFDGDIDISLCAKLEVIEHKNDICRNFGYLCEDKKKAKSDLGGNFLAYLIGTSNQTACAPMTSDIGLPNGTRYHSDLMYPYLNLSSRLMRNKTYSGAKLSSRDSTNIVISACLLLSKGQEQRARDMISMLHSEAVTEAVLESIVQKQFDLLGVKLNL